jgi:hypothetical protein
MSKISEFLRSLTKKEKMQFLLLYVAPASITIFALLYILYADDIKQSLNFLFKRGELENKKKNDDDDKTNDSDYFSWRNKNM